MVAVVLSLRLAPAGATFAGDAASPRQSYPRMLTARLRFDTSSGAAALEGVPVDAMRYEDAATAAERAIDIGQIGRFEGTGGSELGHRGAQPAEKRS